MKRTEDRRPFVLVIEDDPAIRKMLERSLVRMGFEVKTVPNGEIGLSFLRENAVDLVCLDLVLPNRSGFEVCEGLRRLPNNASAPVLVISARSGPDDKAYAEEAGANAYLVKPFRRADLEAHILRLVPARQLREFPGELLGAAGHRHGRRPALEHGAC